VNVFLTYDYELFFGERTGTAQKCLIEPTNELLNLAKRYAIHLTFFVDAGYLYSLEREVERFPSLETDRRQIHRQIERMTAEGHSVQLHVHPHWETSVYDGAKWCIHANGSYKLADFSGEEVVDILQKYKSALESVTGVPATVYRAGGWCIQPFQLVSQTFRDLGIKIDSSVMPGTRFSTEHYRFNFIDAPDVSRYRFEVDVCSPVENGYFLELPIATQWYSPFFYWKLYALGRLFPTRHKMWGDGNFIPQPGVKKKSLFRTLRHHVSSDGYYASALDRALSNFSRQGRTDLVVIGHPKSMTRYSFERLEKFLKRHHKNHSFIALREGC
jgi:hypothetical protein